MTDDRLEDDVRRTFRAKAEALEVDDRAFEPEVGAVVDLHDLAAPRRSRPAMWTALVAAAVIVAGVTVALLVRNPSSAPERRVGETPTSVAEPAPTTTSIAGGAPSQLAPAALVEQVTSVPVSTGRVGADELYPSGLRELPGPRLVAEGGKVRIIWVGAEYCPFCAAQRWPLVIALSRFGTFSDLRVTSSAAASQFGSPEVFPNTASFSFHDASYKSDYIEFEAAETMDNQFEALDDLTPEQTEIFEKYDAPPYVDQQSSGAIPFLDVANLRFLSGASYDTGILQDKAMQQIADALMDPTTDIAKDVGHVANLMTAAICSTLTDPEPVPPVCSEPAITALAIAGPQG